MCVVHFCKHTATSGGRFWALLRAAEGEMEGLPPGSQSSGRLSCATSIEMNGSALAELLFISMGLMDPTFFMEDKATNGY